MTSRYYDVVVLGTELGPLSAGALLARRGFRVLVVGQGSAEDEYSCYGYRFVRRPFRLAAADSPVLRRLLAELTLGQQFPQILVEQEPVYQVVAPRYRVDVFADPSHTEREVVRELGLSAGRVRAVLEELGRLNGEIEKLLAGDIVVPPESFFERREFSRAELQNPFRTLRGNDPLARAAPDARLEEVIAAPLRSESAAPEQLSPLARARLMGGWLFGCRAVRGGRDGLRRLLEERIVGQGGDLQPRQRVTEIAVAKGRVQGVRIADREDLTGCQVVLTDLSPRELAPHVAVGSWSKRFRELVDGAPEPAFGYSVNLGLDRGVIPEGLGGTAFLVFGSGLGADLVRVERIPQPDPERAALNVSCIVPAGELEAIESGALRDALLDRVRWLVPFFDNHLRVLHSSFDGVGPLALGGPAEGEAPAVPHPEEVPRWLIRHPAADGALGVESLPHRTGIRGLFLAGGQVVSGLATEGELLAGWGAARIAGKMDPGRERLVRSMRSKVEM